MFGSPLRHIGFAKDFLFFRFLIEKIIAVAIKCILLQYILKSYNGIKRIKRGPRATLLTSSHNKIGFIYGVVYKTS